MKRWFFPLLIFLPLINGNGRLSQHLQCSSLEEESEITCSGFGYRDGKCHACDCCPACWTCVELHAYGCPERNGLSLQNHTVDLGSFAVGDSVYWSIASDTNLKRTKNSNLIALSGWLQCAAFPSLPSGLTFSDDGILSGVLRPHENEYGEVLFFAMSVQTWRQQIVQRLELRFTVKRNGKDEDGGSVEIQANDREAYEEDFIQNAMAERKAEREAHAHLTSAFRSYQMYYEERRLGHSECIGRMAASLSGVKNVLDAHPRLGGGAFWVWLGALHMNLHKLLENVLPECELYLGLGLLFPPSPASLDDARLNLEGCLAKRKLEAAKFLYLEGLQLMEAGSWGAAEKTLAHAAQLKDGWGWGVNNGEIWVARSAALIVIYCRQLVASAEGADATEVELVAELSAGVRGSEESNPIVGGGASMLDEAAATLQLAFSRQPDLPWTRHNMAAVDRFQTLAHELRGKGGILAGEVAEFTKKTKDWCKEALKHAQPKPRPSYTPSSLPPGASNMQSLPASPSFSSSSSSLPMSSLLLPTTPWTNSSRQRVCPLSHS